MKICSLLFAIAFASCKVAVPNAPAKSGTPYMYEVEKVAYKKGQKIAKVKGFKYWQHVNDTVKAGMWIKVITVK